jgi:hypothetical protein
LKGVGVKRPHQELGNGQPQARKRSSRKQLDECGRCVVVVISVARVVKWGTEHHFHSSQSTDPPIAREKQLPSYVSLGHSQTCGC